MQQKNRSRPIVVVDTNIFINGLFHSRWFRDDESILQLGTTGAVRFAFSRKTLDELYKIVSRHVEKNNLFECSDIHQTLCTLLPRSLFLDPPKTPVLSTDPGDQPFVDLAFACNASFLITRDAKNGLLERAAHQGTRFVTPAQFLKTLRRPPVQSPS